MKYVCLLVVFFCACNLEPEAAVEISKIEHRKIETRIDEIMERMDWPEFALVKMSQNKMYSHKDFDKYTKELIVLNDRLVAIKHWDKAFNRLSKRMVKDLDELQSAVDSKDEGQIELKWHQVKATCKKCHDIYD